MKEKSEYANACAFLGDRFYELAKGRRPLVVVPLRGGYPIWQGILSRLSDRVEISEALEEGEGIGEERLDLEKMTVLYIPASHEYPHINRIYDETMEDFSRAGLEEDDYDIFFVVDEIRSGASARRTVKSLQGLEEERGRNISLLAMADVKGAGLTHQSDNLEKMRKEGVDIHVYQVPNILSMDSPKRHGAKYILDREREHYHVLTEYTLSELAHAESVPDIMKPARGQARSREYHIERGFVKEIKELVKRSPVIGFPSVRDLGYDGVSLENRRPVHNNS